MECATDPFQFIHSLVFTLLKYFHKMHLHEVIIILQVGQFQDDRQSSRLRTLVAHYTPVQVWIIFGS